MKRINEILQITVITSNKCLKEHGPIFYLHEEELIFPTVLPLNFVVLQHQPEITEPTHK